MDESGSRDREKQQPQQQQQQRGAWSENGFEEWGGYMAAKRAKLDVQFNKSVENGCVSKIFAGVTIAINGHVNPTNLRHIFLQHGGSFDSFPTSATDFVIASNLCDATKRKWGSKTVRPEWIMHSIAAGKKLDHRKFLLYDFNVENKQSTIMAAFSKNAESTENCPPQSTAISSAGSVKNGEDTANKSGSGSPSKGKRLMAWEDGFLEEFWDHSRLHNISTMKRTLQLHVGKLRRSASTHNFAELRRYKEEVASSGSNCSNDFHPGEAVLFLVDLDCFFVSVGRLSRPHMVNRPVVVTHFGGNKNISSNSDIACASYESRKFGVKNGMWVSEAKELCPHLEVIPYDFDAYQRVSMAFCNTVAGLTLDIEPGSCDEMLVDVTSVLRSVPGSSPLSLAAFLRRRIFEVTQCKASIGIGKNRLLAKLASKKAKPDGMFMINDDNLGEILESQPLGDLTGVGWSLLENINEKYPTVKTCRDLQQIKLDELKSLFGAKKGETLFNAVRGIDEQKLNFDFERPKSISLDVNYGIRMTEKWQFEKLIMNLCKAISKRAQEAEACGTKVTVTVLTQQKGAPEPRKTGGHGYCDVHNRTANLMNPTRNNLVIYKTVLSMLSNFSVPVEKYRGVSLHLNGLKFDFDGKTGMQPSILTSLKKIPPGEAQRGPEAAGSSKSAPASERPPAANGSSNHVEAQSTSKPYNSSPTKHPNKPEIDPQVLSALPEDIQKEILDHYGLRSIKDIGLTEDGQPVPSTSKAALITNHFPITSVTTAAENSPTKAPEAAKPKKIELSESFMEGLPEDIREEFREDWRLITEGPGRLQKESTSSETADAQKSSIPPGPNPTSIVEINGQVLVNPDNEPSLRVVSISPEENPAGVPFNRVNWWRYDGKDKMPSEHNTLGFTLVTVPSNPTLLVQVPALNGQNEVPLVRKIIREVAYALPNPRRTDLIGLITYFEELIAGHFIKQTQVLLKFLDRLSTDSNVSKKWTKICKILISVCQNKIQRLFGIPLQLHNVEDDEESVEPNL